MPTNPGQRLPYSDRPQNQPGPGRGPDPDPKHGQLLINASQPDPDRMTKGRPPPTHSAENPKMPFVWTSAPMKR